MEIFDYFIVGTICTAMAALVYSCFCAGRMYQHEKEKDNPGEL